MVSALLSRPKSFQPIKHHPFFPFVLRKQEKYQTTGKNKKKNNKKNKQRKRRQIRAKEVHIHAETHKTTERNHIRIKKKKQCFKEL